MRKICRTLRGKLAYNTSDIRSCMLNEVLDELFIRMEIYFNEVACDVSNVHPFSEGIEEKLKSLK